MRRDLEGSLLALLTWLFAAGQALAGTAYVARLIGPGGTTDHLTIQSALDAAELGGGSAEIRVVSSTIGSPIVEELSLDVVAGDSFEISGGWNDLFTERQVPSSWISGADSWTVFTVTVTGGALTIRGLQMIAGLGAEAGGMWLQASGTSEIFMEEVGFVSNVVQQPTSPLFVLRGGGLRVEASDSADIEIASSYFSFNQLEPISPAELAKNEAYGAGAYLETLEDASIVLSDSSFFSNACRGRIAEDGRSRGCNVYASARGNSTIELTRDDFVDPIATEFPGNSNGLNGLLICNDSAAIYDQENRWIGGSADTTQPALYLWAEDDCHIRVRSSLVAQAPTDGVFVFSRDLGPPSAVRSIDVINCTVADNGNLSSHEGLAGNNQGDSGNVSLSNTISFGNGINTQANNYSISGTVALSHNLLFDGAIGFPLFTDPGSFDYSVEWGSPAIDAGDPAPPGGIGTKDILGGMRAQGIVDIGAWELPYLFADGFESGDPLEWSDVQP